MKYFIITLFLSYSFASYATDYYISSSGNDAATGLSESSAWKTIEKVNSRFTYMKPGDKILLRKGDTFYGTLKITTSGVAGNPIIISSYGTGENPVITGFTTITNWESKGNGLYSKTISCESQPQMVTINGIQYGMGRWPNTTWATIDSHNGDASISDADLNSSNTDWTGAEVVQRKGNYYTIDKYPITKHTSNTLFYSGRETNYPSNGWGYFIQNDLKTLDILGEWYFDTKTSTFYLFSGNNKPSDNSIQVATLDNLVTFTSFVDHIKITNISFLGANKIAIYCNHNSHIIVQNCIIDFSGYYGINFYAGSTDNIIENTIINHSNDNGIYVSGNCPRTQIKANTINNTGLIPGMGNSMFYSGSGIMTGESNDLIIEKNKVNNSGYNGILFDGNNTIVRNNYINTFCSIKEDGAGIYYGSNYLNVNITDNIVLNGVGAAGGKPVGEMSLAAGIYLDYSSRSGTKILNNTVAHCTFAGIFLHSAANVTLTNNTVYNSNNCIRFQEFIGNDRPIRNIEMSLNNFFAKNTKQTPLCLISGSNDFNLMGVFNNNYYARPLENAKPILPLINWSGVPKSLGEWQTLYGQDANSKIAPVSIKDSADIDFYFNANETEILINLASPMIDVKGNKYASSITLLPFTSVVLMPDPNPSTPAAIPVFVSGAVESATPSIVEMTYNLTLANVLPSPSSFIVSVNSVPRAVNSVSISGTKVLLTLASPVASADIVSVAYIKPAGNQLQTSSGGQAATLSAQSVTNKVTPPPIPVFVSSSVENVTPSRVDLVYNLPLANIVPAASSFTVLVNSTARQITSVSISGTMVILALSSPVLAGDAVTATYTKPSANPLQTPSGGLAATLGATTITNKVIAPGIPMYVSSALENATPSRIDITYSLALANIVPAASSFTVLLNSVAKTINSVVVAGTKVTLTLASPVVYGDVITVSYSKPAANPLQSTTGGQAYTISAQTVKNNVSPPNPVFASSAVENAAPSKLVITYNLALANIVPAASAFTVLVNSAARAVSSVAISGTTVQLTLGTAVSFGDVITVAYAKPASNPLQTAPGGQAAAFTAQSVTNRVSAIPVPVFTGAGVENATPTVIEMYYSLALANIVPALASFTVKVNSVTKNVIAISVSGSKVLLTLANGIIAEDNVTISYTKPASNPLQTPAGGISATIGAEQVTNKVAPNGPVYVSSVIENAAPNTIEVTYNEALNPSAPGVSAFLVQVNGVNIPVISVTIKGKKVILILESPVVKGDVVTVSYTKPAGNPLQKASGGPAVSIGPQPVTNNVQNLTVIGEIRKGIISIYPNPAVEFINFSTQEASSESHIIKIFDFSGKLCLESRIDPFVDNSRIPINLRSGIYIIQVIIGPLTVFTHKLLVNN